MHDGLAFDSPEVQRKVQLFKWEHIIEPMFRAEVEHATFFRWLQVMHKFPLSYEQMSLERFQQKRKALYIESRDNKDLKLTRDS